MKLTNKTKNNIIAEDIVVANRLFTRIRGLLGKRELGRSEAMILMPCNSVHTFFMKFPIDVIFLNKKHIIIKIIPDLKPFRFTPVFFNASYVVELPAGSAKRSKLEAGDKVILD